MATNTANFGLIKPAPMDFVDIGVLNSNMDKIDAELKRQLDVDNSKVSKTDIIDSCTSSSATQALSANQGKILNEKIDGKSQINDTVASSTSTYSSSKVDNLLNGKANTSHLHSSSDIPSTVAYRTGAVQSNLNADLLDGNHASAFALSTHNHDANYLGKTATATNTYKINGKNITVSATAPSTKAVGDLWISW